MVKKWIFFKKTRYFLIFDYKIKIEFFIQNTA